MDAARLVAAPEEPLRLLKGDNLARRPAIFPDQMPVPLSRDGHLPAADHADYKGPGKHRAVYELNLASLWLPGRHVCGAMCVAPTILSTFVAMRSQGSTHAGPDGFTCGWVELDEQVETCGGEVCRGAVSMSANDGLVRHPAKAANRRRSDAGRVRPGSIGGSLSVTGSV